METINLKYNFTLDIATAHSRLAKRWVNKPWQWRDILRKCAEPVRTAESVSEYKRMYHVTH